MEIDNKLINELEELSKISLNPEEFEETKKDINDIIKYFDILDELDISISKQNVGINNILREDFAENAFSAEQILSGAKESEEGFFKVPKVIGGSSDENS